MQPDFAAISDRLFDDIAARPALWVSNDNESAWHRPGLLSYWVDDAGRDDLEAALGVEMDGRLLSIGRATAEHEGEYAVHGTMWGHVALGLLSSRGFHGLRTQLQLLLFPGDSHSGRWVQPWLEANVSVIGVSAVAGRRRLVPRRRGATGVTALSGGLATDDGAGATGRGHDDTSGGASGAGPAALAVDGRGEGRAPGAPREPRVTDGVTPVRR